MKHESGKGPLAVCFLLFSVFLVLFLAVLFTLILWTGSLDRRLSRLALAGAEIPVSLTVFGRSADTISARFAFGSPDGNLGGTVERSWSGWELDLDCVTVRVGKGFIVFPYQVYTDKSERGRGVDLLRYYDRSGVPVLYDSDRLSRSERGALRTLFRIVKTERWMPGFLGTFHHEVLRVNDFEVNVEYTLFVAEDGSIRFRDN